jgi:hypothetical protein
LFFVETLADIEKEVESGRTPEQVVGNLAEKTPTGGLPNVHHQTLCLYEVLGRSRVEMRERVVVAGGKHFVEGGRRGVVMDESPEIAALNRWRNGQFLGVERAFARGWRQALSMLDLEAIAEEGTAILRREGHPRDLEEAKAMAVGIIGKPGSRYARNALNAILAPETARRAVIRRWQDQGAPPLRAVAPYAAHVVTVDLFFSIALAAGFISRDRPSNRVDIAYLYYERRSR